MLVRSLAEGSLNNIVERALKKAILHRKNSLFYKTRKGAQMGDLFMSLIHTCANSTTSMHSITSLSCCGTPRS